MPTVPSSGHRPGDRSPGERRRFDRPTAAFAPSRVVAPLTLAVVALLAACGGPDHSGASRAAEAFEHAVAADAGAACRMLSERTRTTLESDEQARCEHAIGQLDLPAPGAARETDVYGGDARVITTTDVVFLSRFADGWKVTAAGCTPQPEDRPYDCTVSGG